MEFKLYKKLDIKAGDKVGIKYKDNYCLNRNQSRKFVLTFNALDKESNPTKYFISGINHNSLSEERVRLLHVDKIEIISRYGKRNS